MIRKMAVFGFALGLAMAGFAAVVDGTAYLLDIGETDTFTGTATIPKFTVNGMFTVGADATLTVSGSTSATSIIATNAGINATVNLESGATLDIQSYESANSSQSLAIGKLGGTGTVNVANGALLKASQRIRVGCNASSAEERQMPTLGVINLAGTLQCAWLELAAFFPNATDWISDTNRYLRAAVVNLLPGGLLKPNSISVNDAGIGTLNLQGGTWQFVSAAAGSIGGGSGLMEIHFVEGTTSYLDTGSYNVTFSSSKRTHIFGNGTLVKAGSGKLVLNATYYAFTGPVVVEAGSLYLGHALAEGQTVYVHSGASFVPSIPDDMAKVTYENESERPAADPLYTIDTNISGGLDLLGYDGLYYTDRLGGPTMGGTPRLEGTVTHSDVSVDSPFRLVGHSASGYLILENTGLEALPLAIDGPGKFLFTGSRVIFSEDNDLIQLNDTGEYYQQSALRLFSTNGEPYKVEGGKLSSDHIWIGDSGTNGSVVVTNGTLNASTIDIGANSGSTRYFTTADVAVCKDGLMHSSTPFRFSRTSLNDGSRRGEVNANLTIHEGGIVEGDVYANDDPGIQIVFNGGKLMPNTSQAAVFESAQYSTVEVSASAGKNIIIDSTSATTNTLAVAANNRVHMTGDGGFIKRGKGWLKIGNANALNADYAGDTVLEEGTTTLLGDNLLPYGTGKGTLSIATDAKLDLNGKKLTVNEISSFKSASLVNTASETSELILGADGRDLVSTFTLPANVILGKTGAGTMDVQTSGGAGLHVYEGTARLSGRAYSHYRFKVELVYGTSANSMQIGEFKLLCDGTDVTRPYQSVSRSGTGKASPTPAGKPPETAVSAVDGDLTTKFLDFNGARDNSGSAQLRDECWLQIDYAEPVRVTHYTWATANDQYDPSMTTCRNPMDWRIQGSEDGTTWVDLDVQHGYSTSVGMRHWIADTFTSGGASALSDSPVKVFAGASLILDDGTFSVGSDIAGSVILTNGASLAFSPDAGVTVIDGGNLAGTGSVIMNGDGNLVLAGSNSFTGDIIVNSGTLEINPSPKWFRMTIRKTNSNGDAAMQFSEFQLFDAGGVRQNLNLTRVTSGTDPALLQPGTFCTPAAYAAGKSSEDVDKLFDGQTSTKWCATGVSGLKTGDPSVWRTFTMRLDQNAATVVSYQLTTANDNVGRSPSSWLLEGSCDGISWFVVDDRVNVPHPTTFFTDFNDGTPFELAVLSNGGVVIPPASKVTVANNATLNVASNAGQIGALCVDCENGGGTITLLNCAANGALYLTGADPIPNGYVVPLTISQTLNAENIKSWRIYFNGEPLAGMGAQIVNNQLVLNTKGLIFMVR